MSTKDANKLMGKNILNVFITYRHGYGEKYFDKVKELFDRNIGSIDGFDDFNIIYDGDQPNYKYIGELYDITDLDIYVITEKVDDSESIVKELKDMQARGVPVLPIHFDGFNGENEIRKIITPDTVDALPLNMLDGRSADDASAEFIKRVNSELAHRPKLNRAKQIKKISKEAKPAVNGKTDWNGFFIETRDRFIKGFVTDTSDIVRKVLLILLVIAILSILGYSMTKEEKWQLFKSLMPFIQMF